MNVLLVSSFPPRHCGIGAYAAVEAARLRKAGDRVTVLTFPDGEGDVHVGRYGGRPFRRAVRLGRAADRIVVHFQPALYYRPRRPLSKVATSLSLWWLVARRPRTEVVVHEADRPPRLLRPDYLVLRAAFRRARLVFHTKAELRQLESDYRLRVGRASLADHTAGVEVHSPGPREEARARLGIDPGTVLFLCPGFLHPDKGVDRAVDAFARARFAEGSRLLVILGSIRDRTPENLRYVGRLRDQIDTVPGVVLKDGYLSDADFDRWIAAADLLVLPYRRSWSSGVLARAQMLGTPALVAAVGGLPDQAGPSDEVFETEEELARRMAEVRTGIPAS